MATGQLKRLAWPSAWVWLAIGVVQAAGLLPDLLRHVFVADYAPLFIAGLGLYWCVEAPTPARILLVVIAIATATVGELPRIVANEAGVNMAINRWVLCGLIASLPLLFLAALRARLTPLCYVAGGISYPLYLLHDNLSMVLMPSLGVLAGVAIIVAVALAVFLADERTRPRIRAALARALERALRVPAGRPRQT